MAGHVRTRRQTMDHVSWMMGPARCSGVDVVEELLGGAGAINHRQRRGSETRLDGPGR